MHKILHCLFFPVFLFLSYHLSIAQVVRSFEPDNGPVTNIAPLPKQVNPEDIQKPDPTIGEKKRDIQINPAGPNKKLQTNTTGPTSLITPPQNTETEIRVDLLDPKVSPDEYGVASEKLTPPPAALESVLTFPDLQVNAIQEIPVQQQFYGTEKAPGSAAFKTDGPAAGDRVVPESTPQRPTNGKLEFLRQYAEDLKLQIEKNKRNPDYPSEAKKKELSELENWIQKQ